MESKEKQEAERIVKLFYPLTYTAAIIPYSNQDALRCALIHVEGIINEMNEFENSFSGYGGLKMKTRISQLKEVKQELNKML